MLRQISRAQYHIFLFIYVVITVIPLIWVFLSSFKTRREIAAEPWALPSQLNLDNYISAWSTAKVGTYFLNSLYVALGTCFLTMLIAGTAAFALSRMRLQKISGVVYLFYLLGLVIPVGVLLIPVYNIVISIDNSFIVQTINSVIIYVNSILGTSFESFRFYNNLVTLIIIYTTFALPFTIFVLVAFMKSIPRELEEAAIVDGVGVFGLFFRIVFPISLPAMATTFILNFINSWNELILAMLMITSDEKRTLPVGMTAFRDIFQTNYSTLAAGIVISIIPVIILFILLQKTIIDGITAGSVKG